MEKEIITNQLHDGSMIHDIIIEDKNGDCILLHCKDEESAVSLFKALEDYTIDF